MKHAFHRLPATGTDGKAGWFGRQGRGFIGAATEERPAGVKGDAFAFGAGGGMTEAKMPHGLESPGQDMSQVTPHKLHALHRLGLLNTPVLTIFPGEGDMGISHVSPPALA
jgi:hypothetical protein